MDADRWRRIETLYAAAQALKAEERPAFLAANCVGDDPLRLEVESLLDASSPVFSSSGLASVRSPDEVSTHSYVAVRGAEVPFGFPGSNAGRFVIRERLGMGGMGEVFRADDTQLKRTVAIKRLVHDPRDQSPASRLLKEAQRASALNHPHIASVYDVFTMGSELLLVMEYIDGVTLRERIKRPIAVPDFCAIARQCTDALSTAHDKGILHGDIKPANIMLTRDGLVKVCDFGLARRLPKGDSAADSTTTRHGIVGTPAYLPPEAILEEHIDEHADIFSLGVVFYEMLAGRNPFTGDNVMATVDRILTFSPEPLDRVNPDVPARLARVIHRMLEKNPRDRQASVAEVGEALSAVEAQLSLLQRRRQRMRGVRAAAALAAVALLAAFNVTRVPLPDKINLAVLPFTVTGTTGDRQYFGEGLTESLTDQLAKLLVKNPDFQVATVRDRRARQVTDPVEARDQLGANLVLMGALHYAGDDVRVSASLFDTRSRRQLRTGNFTVQSTDAPAIQAGALDMVVHMLGAPFDPQQLALLNVGATRQPRAVDYYLTARGYLLDYDRIERIDAAIKVFGSALKVDPGYALAYAGLGQAYWRKHDLTGAAEWAVLARGFCESALGIDRDLAESHVCLGMVLNGTGDYEKAADEYNRALKSAPTNDQAYIGLATAYERLGRHDDAEKAYLRAIDVVPHYWGGHNNLGAYYYRSSQYPKALKAFQQVVDLAPDSFRGHSSLGAVQFMLDHTDEAEAAFKKSLEIRPNFAAASNLGTLYYFEEDFRAAADQFRQAVEIDSSSYLVWGNLAQTLEYTGDRAEASKAFKEARRLAQERIDVNPRDASIHLELADYHTALGDAKAAQRELSETLRLAPDDAHTLFRLAIFYEYRLKNRAEALKWLTRAVERGKPWREIDRSPDLRGLRKDPGFERLRRQQ